MPDLGRTSRVNRHHHVFYLHEARGGVTSVNKKHRHVISIIVEERKVLDPLTGQPVMRPVLDPVTGQPTGQQVPLVEPVTSFVVEAAEDGHTHELYAYPEKEPSDTRGKREKADEVIRWFNECMELERKSRAKAKESIRFERGDQWDPVEKERAESNRRPALVLNQIRPNINILCGYQQQNRTDIVYRPVEQGDQMTADIFSHLTKHTLERNSFRFRESGLFRTAGIAGRAVLTVDMDYDKNIEGEIVIREHKWDQIYYSTHNEEDLSDCEVEIRTKWVNERQATEMFPQLQAGIRAMLEPNGERMLNSDTPHRRFKGQQYEMGEEGVNYDRSLLVDLPRKAVRVVEMWRKDYEQTYVAAYTDDNFYAPLDGWTKTDTRFLRSIPGFELIPRMIYRIKVTTIVGEEFVSDTYPELAVPEFSSFPLYCYKYEDDWEGLVEDAKDPQRELNKKASQAMDILARTNGAGWIYDEETFPSKEEEKKFLRNVGRPGFAAKINSLERPPIKVDGQTYPTGLINGVQLSAEKIREIMNVTLDMVGTPGVESGKAIALRKQQGLIGNNHLFDKLSYLKQRLGRYLIYMFQRYYTPERVVRLLRSQNQDNSVQLANQPLDTYTDEQIIKALVASRAEYYDVVVDESNHNPTRRMANFEQWAQMKIHGLTYVPEEVLVDMSDLPNKDQVKQAIAQARQAEMQSNANQNKSETDKTLISALSKNPNVDPNILLQIGGYSNQSQSQPQPQLPEEPTGGSPGI